MKSLYLFELQEIAPELYRAISLTPNSDYVDRTFLDKSEALKFLQREVTKEMMRHEASINISSNRQSYRHFLP